VSETDGDAVPSGRTARSLPSRLTDVRDSAWSLVTTTAGLTVALLLVPGVKLTVPWSVVWVALAVTVGDALLRPALRLLATRSGPAGALILGLAAQVVVAWFALTRLPGLHASSGWDVVGVLLIAAVVMAAGRWLFGLRDNDYVLGDLRRRARRAARRRARRSADETGPDPHAGPGLLVVQLDGLAAPTLDYAVRAGLAPTLTRWLQDGTHRSEPWWARVPSTTPASQAGLLHEAADEIPAFRWWDRELGRLLVTNRPGDAAVIEQRLSAGRPGRGLLARGGAAVSTMFTGQAAISLLVVSRGSRGLGPGATFVEFCSSPFVLARALLLTVGEMVKELYQGWQQTVRRVEPRVSRLGAYPALRAITNVLLRDLNTSLVAEQMLAGAPVVFVDFVDYDEIAHHAGPLRPESLRALEGLDRVVGLLERFACETPRGYDVVVLSDHGQSLGKPFAQAYGATLEDLVQSLTDASAQSGRDRSRGAAEALHEHREDWRQVVSALRALGGTARDEDALGPEPPDLVSPVPVGAEGSGGIGADAIERELVVAASGNFAGVWITDVSGPWSLGAIERRWPDLVPGLAAHPGIGVVVGRDDDGHPVAVGGGGVRDLVTGTIEGEDPTTVFGPQAAADLERAAGLSSAADLLIVSSVDDVGLVHPFEGLVGSHGGLGGEQNRAVLMYPATWHVDDALRSDVGPERMLVGADAVHRQLVAWLTAAHLRDEPAERP
jgi:hypothetical protein